MQRIRKFVLLVIFNVLSASLVGCVEDRSSSKTVSDYIHDMDLARAAVEEAKKDLAKNGNSPAAINASAAIARSVSPEMLECWSGRISTTTTDHDCLDRKGFTR